MSAKRPVLTLLGHGDGTSTSTCRLVALHCLRCSSSSISNHPNARNLLLLLKSNGLTPFGFFSSFHLWCASSALFSGRLHLFLVGTKDHRPSCHLLRPVHCFRRCGGPDARDCNGPHSSRPEPFHCWQYDVHVPALRRLDVRRLPSNGLVPSGQGRLGDDAGVSTIPLVLSLVIMSIVAAICMEKIGYYVPVMLPFPVLCSIGAGLLSTLSPSSGHNVWIGYQVLYSFGIGCGFQTSNLPTQNVLPRADVPLGLA